MKVVKYDLAPNDYIVDGEILVDDTTEPPSEFLIRMPVALVSLGYLRRTFGTKHLDWHRYTEGPAPSIDVGTAPASRDVHLFYGDLRQRLNVIKGLNPATARERTRMLDWYDKFGRQFFDRSGAPSTKRLPALFVPGTAKILSLYFEQCERKRTP